LSHLILVSNDDGIEAEGLACLTRSLQGLGEVVVVAPARNHSGASHSLTLGRPLKVRRTAPGWFAVEGTPADCVNLGFFRLSGRPPDLVVSGINAGLNIGDDVAYSGTVAAALEGALLGRPGMAVSMDRASLGGDGWTAAGEVALLLARKILERGLPEDTLLNVNVPSGEPRGIRWTRQGRRIPHRPPEMGGGTAAVAAIGEEEFWISDLPLDWKNDPLSDYCAVSEGFISVTPLHLDLTHHRVLEELGGWQLSLE